MPLTGALLKGILILAFSHSVYYAGLLHFVDRGWILPWIEVKLVQNLNFLLQLQLLICNSAIINLLAASLIMMAPRINNNYRIAGNFGGRKVSRIGMKGAFRG